MKGIVFNLLEDIVTRHHQASRWDALLEQTKLDGVYTSLGGYADEDFVALVTALAAHRDEEVSHTIRWFGREAMPLLAEKYRAFFQPHSSTREFLLTLNSIIHPEVRKLYPGADVPDFEFDASSPDVLVMVYRSQRRLCAFAEGLIDGAAAHFREKVNIAHPRCMHRGADSCRLELRFQPLVAAR